MQPKKTPSAKAESHENSTGIPVVEFDTVLAGTCPVCFQPCHVGTHRKGGYYVACPCGLRLFTRNGTGSVIFRAQQEVLADPELRATLQEMNASHFDYFVDKMLKSAAP